MITVLAAMIVLDRRRYLPSKCGLWCISNQTLSQPVASLPPGGERVLKASLMSRLNNERVEPAAAALSYWTDFYFPLNIVCVKLTQ